MRKIPTLLKEQALTIFNGNASALADALGITRSAVCMWPDCEAIPNERYLQLRYQIAPQFFDKEGFFVHPSPAREGGGV